MSPAPWKEDRWEEVGPGRYRRRTGGGVAAAVAETPEESGDVDATAAAVKLAAKEGVDLASISGSGAGGRITVGDVKAAAGT